jgi:3-hydroxyacyl-CoA dehydrogenase
MPASLLPFYIRKVAVLGAGVMGAQIAAHMVNAGIPVILYDLAAADGDRNQLAKQGIERLKKLKPAPLAEADYTAFIQPANFEDDLAALAECDLIIEAIGERMEWKNALYQKVAAFLRPGTVFASNTSGLNLEALAQNLTVEQRPYFCGIHFFNPPRYMHLVELTPHSTTAPALLDNLEQFLVSELGKGVIRAKDTPCFIANRVGVFSLLAIFMHAEQYGLHPEEVDALTGPLIGRPKSATYRTVDVVGLDTLAHVVHTLADELPNDPWAGCYKVPTWLEQLITQGNLGQKTGAGIYRKEKQDILVWNAAATNYRPLQYTIAPEVNDILQLTNAQAKFAALRQSTHSQAQFLWACFRDLFHYCAYHAESIADTVRDIDLALRWGFGWQQGPFETWQSTDWRTIAQWINEDIQAGKTLAKATLPAWVTQQHCVYESQTAFSPAHRKFETRSNLAVYKRQLFPQTVLGETVDTGETIFETADARCWHQHDGIAILSFKTKFHTINQGVIDAVVQAVDIAEKKYQGLVIWQTEGENFSFGANLKFFSQLLQETPELGDAVVASFQYACLRLRYAAVPTIAAIRGLTLGGGCEFSMHCSRIVAAFETYIGLVEVGVGLLPAGGGSKELAYRAYLHNPDDPMQMLSKYFKMVATAQTAGNAKEAKKLGFLKPEDIVVMHTDEVLYVAKQQIKNLCEINYRSPLIPQFKVAGKTGIATCQTQLINMREGGFISEYDYYLVSKVAEVLCGGYVEAGSLVDETWLLALERKNFLELANNPMTQARIQHMLTTGKALRN